MTSGTWTWVCGAAILLVVNGCSRPGPHDAFSGLTREFQAAEPPLKAKVESSIAAFKTNNYVGAIVALQEVTATSALTRNQQKAVEDMLQLVTARLYEGVEKGDTNAIQARDALQQLRRRSR